MNVVLRGQCREIFDFRFFHESVSPKAFEYPIGSLTAVSRPLLPVYHPPGSATPACIAG
jgi:hypothetical protein